MKAMRICICSGFGKHGRIPLTFGVHHTFISKNVSKFWLKLRNAQYRFAIPHVVYIDICTLCLLDFRHDE
jgi:hypothetical protein